MNCFGTPNKEPIKESNAEFTAESTKFSIDSFETPTAPFNEFTAESIKLLPELLLPLLEDDEELPELLLPLLEDDEELPELLLPLLEDDEELLTALYADDAKLLAVEVALLKEWDTLLTACETLLDTE